VAEFLKLPQFSNTIVSEMNVGGGLIDSSFIRNGRPTQLIRSSSSLMICPALFRKPELLLECMINDRIATWPARYLFFISNSLHLVDRERPHFAC